MFDFKKREDEVAYKIEKNSGVFAEYDVGSMLFRRMGESMPYLTGRKNDNGESVWVYLAGYEIVNLVKEGVLTLVEE